VITLPCISSQWFDLNKVNKNGWLCRSK
jgi:hypothetical protein